MNIFFVGNYDLMTTQNVLAAKNYRFKFQQANLSSLLI